MIDKYIIYSSDVMKRIDFEVKYIVFDTGYTERIADEEKMDQLEFLVKRQD